MFELRRSQCPATLEIAYFFQEIKERAWKLDRDFFVSSETKSIQGKIDKIETQKNEY